jgi:hypothetical protein
MWLKDSEQLYGIWVNTDYNTNWGLPAKRIFNPEGTWAKYERIDSPICYSGTFTVTDKWTDPKENTWYKVFAVGPRAGTYYFLTKISNCGKILECACSIFDYPIRVEPSSCPENHLPAFEYSIYYRQ